MKQDQKPQKAVIYCRVSSVKQATEGHGLSSQETRCREFARFKGYDVVAAYHDDISGSMTERDGMMSMLKYLRGKPEKSHVVLIDDISRLARGIQAHFQLRQAISSAGALLESPSIEFGEDSDSILVENMLASVAQHHRQKNQEQTLNRMRARMMNGYYTFYRPWGYKYKKVAGHGKILVRDEPMASIIQEALEGFASGRFETQAEVKRFLETQPAFPKDHRGEVHNQRVTHLLNRTLYSGYIEHEEWGVSLRKGHHEGLIDLETYQRIQDRLKGRAKVPNTHNINLDFPLRGFIACGECGHTMTANWSKGRNGRYPYYLCRNRECKCNGKSIRRAEVEGAFEKLLEGMRPGVALFEVFKVMFDDLWNARLSLNKSKRAQLRKEQETLEKKSSALIARLVDAGSETLIKAYEEEIKVVERKKLLVMEKIEKMRQPRTNHRDTYRTALDFLSNPLNLWHSDRLEDKRAVLKLAFSDKIQYVRGSGFRTAPIAQPFLLTEQLAGDKDGMADREGFEPSMSD